ncbi:hypothetical protein LCER1_G009138 [Lachnellula cervina]|uniref:Retroviral polymerase SH3-like domain-containing protein n=1 Tax=Lachnellula cervina TaxID=1316786 RepID=A0A7D8UI33_9HELO|nr:hypothetical protein LCER1_G009138 [Lachnellula cervina]
MLVDFNKLEPIVYYTKSENNKLDLYYKRLNHLNKNILLKTIDNTFGLSLDNNKASNNSISDCELCFIESKTPISTTLVLSVYNINIIGSIRQLGPKREKTYNSIIDKTPFEALTNKKPFIGYIKILGSLVYTLVLKETRKYSKLSEKGNKGILIGFELANNFLVYLPIENKVISTKNLIIKEDLNY